MMTQLRQHSVVIKVGSAMRTLSQVSLCLLSMATVAQVHAGCAISSTGLAFGAYQPITFASKKTSKDLLSDATVSLACSGIATGGSYTISLGPSTAGNGNRISTRYLSNTAGGDPMLFNVYTDYNRSIVWGDATAGTLINGSIAAGNSNQLHKVYGKILAGQNKLSAGSYLTTLTMTLTYNP